jgi:hypothetical protein
MFHKVKIVRYIREYAYIFRWLQNNPELRKAIYNMNSHG